MHSLCGRPTRSHTVPSPSPYILVASARATVSAAGLDVGRGCPGHGRQHPACSRSTPTYVGPPLFPPLRGLLLSLLLQLRSGHWRILVAAAPSTGNTPISAIWLKMIIWTTYGLINVSWRFLKEMVAVKSHPKDLRFALHDFDLMFANAA